MKRRLMGLRATLFPPVTFFGVMLTTISCWAMYGGSPSPPSPDVLVTSPEMFVQILNQMVVATAASWFAAPALLYFGVGFMSFGIVGLIVSAVLEPSEKVTVTKEQPAIATGPNWHLYADRDLEAISDDSTREEPAR